MAIFGDPRERLNNFYYIIDKKGQRVQFKLNWAQETIFDDMHYLNIVLKARQLGFTTFFQIFMLDACLFNSNIRAATVAHTLPTAQAIFRDKIQYPYDNLPEQIRAMLPATASSANELSFSNNSSLRVATSLRSGTLQYLHVSEHGKLCASYPDKALEIKTGALNTVDVGQMIFIESTAEGQAGDFHDMCMAAQRRARLEQPLTPLDFKFFFFPWWKEPTYRLDPEGVIITADFVEYFEKLEEQEIELDDAQKAWYVKKAELQGEHMKREFPSTPKEAFEASMDGAYYSRQLAKAETEKRICSVPYDENIPVYTFWDIGMNDMTSIWFAQFYGAQVRVIDYYQNSGEGMAHYVKVVKDRPYVYAEHWAPHDIKVRELGSGNTRLESARKLGIRFRITPKVSVEDGINASRSVLARTWFDESKCSEGVKGLRAYRKEWDEKLGTWKKKPLHDWASNPADGYRYLAVAYRAKMGDPVDPETEHRPETFRELLNAKIADSRHNSEWI